MMLRSLVGVVLLAATTCSFLALSLADDKNKEVVVAQKPRFPNYATHTLPLENTNLPLEQPEILWKYVSETTVLPDGTTEAVQLTEPVVAEGVVYFGDDKGRLFALRTDDGSEVWKYTHDTRIYWRPAVDKDHVYFATGAGTTTAPGTGVGAVRRKDGTLAWWQAIPLGANAPIPVNRHVYVAGHDGRAYALDWATGEVIWEHDFAGDAPPDPPGWDGKRARFQNIVARPAGSSCDGQVFVLCVFDQCRVIAVDCATGRRRWTFQAAGWMKGTPTIVGDHVYFCSQDSHVYCVKRDSGELVWKHKTSDWFGTSPVIVEGKVFITQHRGRLSQLATDSGDLLKTFQAADAEESKSLAGCSPLIANGICYFASAKGLVYALDMQTHRLRWQLQPSDSSELVHELVTDGERLLMQSRQNLEKQGEAAIIALGKKLAE